MLIQSLIVGAGGFFGSILRFITGRIFLHIAGNAFPMATATATVNIAGCFLIGWIAKSTDSFSEGPRLFLMTGILGGFTTFSAFGLETFSLIRDQNYFGAGTNITLNVIGGLLAVWIGSKMT